MTINIISCVIPYKNRLAIGKNNDLLVKLKNDQRFFKKITMESLSSSSKLDKNVVLMGRKTWFSITQEKRPLENRINLVLTNDCDLLKLSPYNSKKMINKDLYFLNYKQFLQFYEKYNPNVFVIGGSNIYNLFLKENSVFLANNIYLTEVKNYKLKDEPDTFIDIPDYRYRLIGYSEKYETEKCNYRILNYKLASLTDELRNEISYLDLVKKVLKNGNERIDRTNVGTISTFGESLRFDISNGTLPLLTTKRVPLKACIEELLFFCRGDTDSKILDNRGVKIWNGNSSREFLDKRGLFNYKEGILGPIYGWQWRFFGANYSQAFADTSLIDTSKIGGVDQLSQVLHQLKTDPFSRRIIISAWNPTDLNKMCLPPCFPADTLVLTNNGYKNIQNVLLTDKLFTHKGNWKDINNLQKKEYNDQMYEFKLRYNSKSLKVTKEHPFLVKDIIRKSDKTIISYSNDTYWCNAEYMTKDQVMCLPVNKNSIVPKFNQIKNYNQFRSENITKIINNKDEFFMLGFYIGDGWIDLKRKGRFYICINKNDDTLLHIYKKISNVINLIYKDETDKIIRYECCDILWWEILKDFGHLAHNKKIPEWIQDSPKESIQLFIDGYIAADGCKTIKNYEKFTTVSADLAYGFQRLYAKIGKVLAVSYQKRPPTTIIEGRTVNQRNTYHMSVIKNKKCKYVSNIDENYIYFNVMNIDKKIENTTVYNFEVNDDNSYTIQNISVHNCHYSIQFYVEEKDNEKYLSASFNMRSSDVFLGLPFNIASYSILLNILAKKAGMKTKEIIYNGGDVHIYKNHINQVKEQLERRPRPFPKIHLNQRIQYIDWSDIKYSDFELIGYFPHEKLFAPMAV